MLAEVLGLRGQDDRGSGGARASAGALRGQGQRRGRRANASLAARPRRVRGARGAGSPRPLSRSAGRAYDFVDADRRERQRQRECRHEREDRKSLEDRRMHVSHLLSAAMRRPSGRAPNGPVTAGSRPANGGRQLSAASVRRIADAGLGPPGAELCALPLPARGRGRSLPWKLERREARRHRAEPGVVSGDTRRFSGTVTAGDCPAFIRGRGRRGGSRGQTPSGICPGL